MVDRLFVYDQEADTAIPVTAKVADRDYRDTDAGANHDLFIVVAVDQMVAVDGARRWIANWADESSDTVPDDLCLEEREYREGKTYMTLRVAS